MWGRWIVVTAVISGCLRTSSVSCPDGRVCPSELRCEMTHGLCVSDDQLQTCVGLADGTACLIRGSIEGSCRTEVCIEQQCGDGILSAPEQCDGADLAGAVDCMSLGYYDPVPLTCSPSCTYNELVCTGKCGDLAVNGTEYCDGDPPVASCTEYGFGFGAIGCTSFCSPGFDACRSLGWTRIASGVSSRLEAIWADPATNQAWVVGAAGTVLHWNGVTWSAVATGSTADLFGVSGRGESVWAVGAAGIALHRDAGTWSETATPAQVTLRDVWVTPSGQAIAVGDGGVVVHHDGTSWSLASSGTSNDLVAVWGRTDTEVFAVGAGGVVTRWNGSAWTAIVLEPSVSFVDIVGTDDGSVTAIASNSVQQVWALTATGWEEQPSNDATDSVAIAAVDSDHVLVIERGGRAVHFDGGAWEYMSPDADGAAGSVGNSTIELTDLAMLGAGDVIAIGKDGLLLRYRGLHEQSFRIADVELVNDVWSNGPNDVVAVGDSGAIWNQVGRQWFRSTPTSGHLFAVSGAGDAYTAVGSSGTILHRAGTGAWTPPAATPSSVTLLDVWMVSATEAFAVGQSGTVLHWKDGAWTSAQPGTGTLRAVHGTGPTDVFVVGNGGTILHYDGAWSAQASMTTRDLVGVWAAAPDRVFAVGVQGTLLVYDGAQWSQADTAPLPGTLKSVSGTARDDVFVVGEDGAALHYDGVAWRAIQPSYRTDHERVVATPRHVYFLDHEPGTPPISWVHEIVRTAPWSCRAMETACSDGTDDDCDGLRDARDPDCP